MLHKILSYIYVTMALLSYSAFAQVKELPNFSSATFVRVTSVSDIQDDSFYLIGGNDHTGNTLYLMTDQKFKKKLQARHADNNTPAIITQAKRNEVWSIKTTKEGFHILTVDGKQAIATKGNNIWIDNSDKASLWNITPIQKHRFLFESNNNLNYYLGASIYDSNSSYFGTFKKSSIDYPGIVLYKYAGPIDEKQGKAVTPEDGSQVAICSTHLLMDKEGKAVENSDVLLTDGSLAIGNYKAWTVSLHGQQFALSDTDHQLLQYDLSAKDNNVLWQIRNGQIATLEDTPRYLIEKDGCFALASSPNDGHACFFRTVQPPSSIEEQAHTLILKGGWSASQLANISWQGGRNLDLTQIKLPRFPQTFTNKNNGANSIIYVSKEQIAYIPTSWQLCVTESELIRPSELKDKSPFWPEKSLHVKAGQLSYTRELVDGNWETFCIPFDADLPDGFQAQKLEEANKGELHFNPVNKLTANQPVIIRANSKGRTTFKVTNTGNQVQPLLDENNIFYCNYDTLHISTSSNIYLLGNNGQSFIKAAAGSRLLPFRAYIKMKAVPNRIRVCTSLQQHTQLRKQ